MPALAPFKCADRLRGQRGALRQLFLAQSCSFTVPPELSPEAAGALARAHGRVLVPIADRVGASECGGSVGVPLVGATPPLNKADSHPHSEGHPSVGSDVGSPASREIPGDRSTASERTPAMASSTPDPRRWAALAIIAVAQFVVIMDTSIIGVALPEIQRAFQFSQPDLSWVFNAYVIAFGGLLLLGGRLADLYGARRVFMAGFAILGGASLITGLAPSESVLLAGRALQGVGSALIAPAALTM